MKRISTLILLLFLIQFQQKELVAQITASEQPWKKLILLVSTCEDVKKVLGDKTYLGNCKDGESLHYKFPDYWVSVHFTTETCKNYKTNVNVYNVQKGSVIYVSVSLIRLIPLKDYESDLSKYEIKPVSDLEGASSYINEKEGLTLSVYEVRTGEGKYEKMVTSILLYPSLNQKKKQKCH